MSYLRNSFMARYVNPELANTISQENKEIVDVLDVVETPEVEETEGDLVLNPTDIAEELKEQCKEGIDANETKASLESIYDLTCQQLELGGMSKATQSAVLISLKAVSLESKHLSNIDTFGLEADESILDKVVNSISRIKQTISNSLSETWRGMKQFFQSSERYCKGLRTQISDLKRSLNKNNEGNKPILMPAKHIKNMCLEGRALDGQAYVGGLQESLEILMGMANVYIDANNFIDTVDGFINVLQGGKHFDRKKILAFLYKLPNLVKIDYTISRRKGCIEGKTRTYMSNYYFKSVQADKKYVEEFLSNLKAQRPTGVKTEFVSGHEMTEQNVRDAVAFGAVVASTYYSIQGEGDKMLAADVVDMVASDKYRKYTQQMSAQDIVIYSNEFTFEELKFKPVSTEVKSLNYKDSLTLLNMVDDVCSHVITTVNAFDKLNDFEQSFQEILTRDNSKYLAKRYNSTIKNLNYCRHLVHNWLFNLTVTLIEVRERLVKHADTTVVYIANSNKG